jgi:hypothetical protein
MTDNGGEVALEGFEYQKLGLLRELLYRNCQVGKYEAEDDYVILNPSTMSPRRYVQAKYQAYSQEGRLTPSWFFNNVLEHFERVFISESIQNTDKELILLTDAYPNNDLEKIFELFDYLRTEEGSNISIQGLKNSKDGRKKYQTFQKIYEELDLIDNETKALNLFRHTKLYKGTPSETLKMKVENELVKLGSKNPEKDIQQLKGLLLERTDEIISREELLSELGYEDYRKSSPKERNHEFKTQISETRKKVENQLSTIDSLDEEAGNWDNPKDLGLDASAAYEKESMDDSNKAKEIREAGRDFEERTHELRNDLKSAQHKLKFIEEDLDTMEEKSKEFQEDIDG